MKAAVSAIRRFGRAIIDTILPRRARAIRTESLSLEDVPLSPAGHELLHEQVTTLLDYREPRVADIIRSLKYDASVPSARLCAGVLAGYLAEELSSDTIFSTKHIVLVPVPLHLTRRRERGFNQVEAVLQALPPALRDGTMAEIRTDLIVRTRETGQQARLRRHERLGNVAGAFALTARHDLHRVHVYLIDDVATTGATLVHAARPLRASGAEVTLIALARG